MPSSGRVLQLNDIIQKDQLGCSIAENYIEWEMYRAPKVAAWRELRGYIYATDTSTTTNQTLPWKNTTTTPKLTSIRDNLHANYMATVFPKSRWLNWEGASDDDETPAKVEAIKAYMQYVIDQPGFKETVSNLIYDYIDFGNCFVTMDWLDQRVDTKDGRIQHGFVGPVAKRISPLDLVLNPLAPTVIQAPKIERSIVLMGEVKEMLERLSQDPEEQKANLKLWEYIKGYRNEVSQFAGDLATQDAFFRMDGFDSYQSYLKSDYCEVLTFSGDIYDRQKDEFLKNHVVQVVDRHKVIRKTPNPSFFGYTPIWHSGWRPRQDNLWAMGPLDNLVGMQYRLDHIENLKADLFDLVAFPPLKVKGYVEDFTWAPFEKIITDAEGDVEVMKVDTNPLNANFELDRLQREMEEKAGAPREAMGFRSPGEKTAYEVQRLENAAARIFQSKIAQFEEQILEPLLNGMLELARRRMNETTVRVISDEFKIASFMSLTPEDITGAGRIRPLTARHFVEQAELVQNLTQFYGSGIGADEAVRAHISSIKMAELFEELLNIGDYKLVLPYIRLTEQNEAQQLMAQGQEDNQMAMTTPGGIAQDDANVPPEGANPMQGLAIQ